QGAKWESFGRQPGDGQKVVTIGTVLKLAWDGGWKGAGTDPDKEFENVDEVPGGRKTAGEAPPKPAGAAKPLTLWPDDQPLDAGIEWTIDELLPKQGIGFLAAPSTYGKTFLLFHFCLCVARGTPFFGRAIDAPGGSYLVAGEGAYSVPHRVAA